MQSKKSFQSAQLALFLILFFISVFFQFSTSKAIADQDLETYHFGLPPYQKGQPIDDIRGLYKPMLLWLGDQVGCRFDLPNALMREQGIISKNFFRKVYFLGSHPRITDALVTGSIDAGATWDFNLEQAKKKHGDLFKIIHVPPPIPNVALVAHQTLPPDIQKKIQQVLPTIDPALLRGLLIHSEHLEEKVRKRTAEMQKIVNAMAGREVLMAELKEEVKRLQDQLKDA